MIGHPLSFLTGFGFFSYESARFYHSTHNVYLSYLYNLGLIGLILFIAVFARILATARLAVVHASAEYRSQLLALVFGLFAFLIAIFFSEYQTSGYLLWAYMGVGMRVATQARRSTNTASDGVGAMDGLPAPAAPRGRN
jgi:O-antigen ligase